MKTTLPLLLLSISMMSVSGTAFGQKLYPVQGPLSSESPAPVISGQIRRPIFSAGSIVKLLKSWELPSGEVLTGKCVDLKMTSLNTKTLGTSESYPPQPNLAFAWDAVYGAGFSTAHLLGTDIWQGTFKGGQGTVMQVEITADAHRGVAVDNRGNTYKVVWE